MHRKDFLRLSGADQQTVDYLPVALLLRTGYGVAGYYNTSMNQGLEDLIVLLNARLIDLRNRSGHGVVVTDFNEFLEKVVFEHYRSTDAQTEPITHEHGTTIPLAAISLSDVAVFYPVAQISRLMRLIQKNGAIASLVVPTIEETLGGMPGKPTDVPMAQPVAASSAEPAPQSVTVTVTTIETVTAESVPASTITAPATPSVPVDSGVTALPTPPAPAIPAAPPAPPESAVAAAPEPAAATPAKETQVPTFLDFNNKSVVLAVLRTKLW